MKLLLVLALFLSGCLATTPNNVPTSLDIDKELLVECKESKIKLGTPEETDVLQLIKDLALEAKECRQRQKASVVILKKLSTPAK